MTFPRAAIWVPGEVERYEAAVEAFRGFGVPDKPRLVKWHGKECEILGIAREHGYAAVRFPWNGFYEYEIVPKEAVCPL